MANELPLSAMVTNRHAWSMNQAHYWLGNPDKDTTREIVIGLGLNVEQG